jgi:hypothetical protein
VLDWSNANLPDPQRAALEDAARTSATSGQVYAIVRGEFAPTNTTTPRPDLGRFVITEAWLADGDGDATGAFVRVTDNGLRCFAEPCPHLTEQTLNTSQVTDIARVDFAPADLSDSELEVDTEAMYDPEGIVVAGSRFVVQANGSTADGRTATQAYRRLSGADTTVDATQ